MEAQLRSVPEQEAYPNRPSQVSSPLKGAEPGAQKDEEEKAAALDGDEGDALKQTSESEVVKVPSRTTDSS